MHHILRSGHPLPSVRLLDEALRLLQECGYMLRQEYLDGAVGGACILRGRKLFFLDLALGPEEQLERALEALRDEPALSQLPISPNLANLLKSPKAS